MQAEIIGDFLCSECHQILMKTYQGRVLWCVTPECPHRGKKFHAPTIELKPIEEVEHANQG